MNEIKATLRLLADRRRQAILLNLGGQSLTSRELAEELDLPQSQVRYHVRRLCDHHLVQPTRQRRASYQLSESVRVADFKGQRICDIQLPSGERITFAIAAQSGH